LYTGAGAWKTANGFWKLFHKKPHVYAGKREGKLGLCVHATGERLFGLRNGLSVQRIALPRLLTTGDGLEEITFGIDSLNGMPK
jgi:hypothetical protein